MQIPEVTGDATGGANILSYNLQFKGGLQTEYISIVGETVNNLQLTISKQNLQTDEEYTFRYRIRTNYGWSDDFSPELQARTATIPS